MSPASWRVSTRSVDDADASDLQAETANVESHVDSAVVSLQWHHKH